MRTILLALAIAAAVIAAVLALGDDTPDLADIAAATAISLGLFYGSQLTHD